MNGCLVGLVRLLSHNEWISEGGHFASRLCKELHDHGVVQANTGNIGWKKGDTLEFRKISQLRFLIVEVKYSRFLCLEATAEHGNVVNLRMQHFTRLEAFLHPDLAA